MALVLLLVSGLGHLADAGQLAWRGPASLLGTPWFHALVATLALAVAGRPILVGGMRSALVGVPGMDSLVGLGVASAYLSSLVGWLWPASGWPCYFNEPVMLLGFVLTGRFLEERARYRTGRAIEELGALQPDHALLLLGDGPPRQVRVGGLRPGDRLRLLPGDRVPVDVVIREGASCVDTSCLTGESLPRPVQPGSELAAGQLNLEGSLVVEVLRCGAESAIARIVNLVERAQARKAPIQGLADRLAGRFSLAVLLLALATLLFWWLWGGRHWPAVLTTAVVPGAHGHGGGGPATPFALGLQLAIAVLVVACPCALGLATPTAITVGSGRAARSGLLFRGGDAIETASRLGAVLFDKTGTLTVGRPMVTAVRAVGRCRRGPGAPRRPPRPTGWCSWRPVSSSTAAIPWPTPCSRRPRTAGAVPAARRGGPGRGGRRRAGSAGGCRWGAGGPAGLVAPRRAWRWIRPPRPCSRSWRAAAPACWRWPPRGSCWGCWPSRISSAAMRPPP